MWLANAEYVAAAVHSGILGFITAASFSSLDALRDEIQKCRDLSQGMPLGVNVSLLPPRVTGEQTDEVFELIAKEGIPFIETSGRSPEPYMPLIKEAGIKILHKVSTVRHAVSAQRHGVDAVSIVGAECGGHPGVEMGGTNNGDRSEEHTSELQSRGHLVCRLLLEKTNPLYPSREPLET